MMQARPEAARARRDSAPLGTIPPGTDGISNGFDRSLGAFRRCRRNRQICRIWLWLTRRLSPCNRRQGPKLIRAYPLPARMSQMLPACQWLGRQEPEDRAVSCQASQARRAVGADYALNGTAWG